MLNLEVFFRKTLGIFTQSNKVTSSDFIFMKSNNVIMHYIPFERMVSNFNRFVCNFVIFE